jgi:hypothetical protein
VLGRNATEKGEKKRGGGGRNPCGNTAVILLTASQEFHITDIKKTHYSGIVSRSVTEKERKKYYGINT